jgi:copper(I)-binding protein
MKFPIQWRVAALLSLFLLPAASWAQTRVSDAFVRGTVAQQKATGAFLKLTSVQGGRLVAVASPVAMLAEIHEMKMDGNTMRMAEVPFIELPAGQPVELKPGGYHLMLMGLKQTLKDGDSVPLVLTIEGKDGKKETVELKAPVKALGVPGGMKM